MIKADLTKFVDDHQAIGEGWIFQHAIEQAGFASTQKARQHGEGNGRGRAAREYGRVRHHRSFKASFAGSEGAHDLSLLSRAEWVCCWAQNLCFAPEFCWAIFSPLWHFWSSLL